MHIVPRRSYMPPSLCLTWNQHIETTRIYTVFFRVNFRVVCVRMTKREKNGSPTIDAIHLFINSCSPELNCNLSKMPKYDPTGSTYTLCCFFFQCAVRSIKFLAKNFYFHIVRCNFFSLSRLWVWFCILNQSFFSKKRSCQTANFRRYFKLPPPKKILGKNSLLLLGNEKRRKFQRLDLTRCDRFNVISVINLPKTGRNVYAVHIVAPPVSINAKETN